MQYIVSVYLNYCPIVCHFCCKVCQKKDRKNTRRIIKILYDDQTCTYECLLEHYSISTFYLRLIYAITSEVLKSEKYKSKIHDQNVYN